MGVGVLLITALVLILVLAGCRSIGLWTWTAAWIFSNREEKVSLTRLKGHYNANGYLITSDSDIQLDCTGSFQHFDSVDREVWTPPVDSTLSTTVAPEIPLQPLRPAPSPVPPPSPKPVEPSPPPPLTPQAPPAISTNPFLADIMEPVVVLPPPLVTEEVTERVVPQLQRAMSCDSVCSDTSVSAADLQEPNVTGYLCVGLEYDSEVADLMVNVLEAKDLVSSDVNHPQHQPLDTYVRVYLLPDKTTNMQTRVYRKSNSPSYKERFLFALEPTEYHRRSLSFYIYATDRASSSLLGEAELRLCDVNARQPVTTWLTLTDTGQTSTELGEVMFSLSYLPTAERLTVVLVKARNLKFHRESGDPFVKVYLLQHGKKAHKKKTSTKRGERSPIYNEAMMFSVPPHTLQTIQLRVTVSETGSEGRALNIGHVIVGSQSTGKALTHWTQMLTSLRKPIAMWHPLRSK
ncbi:synaptotagmin-12-like [Macrosteles quadrilineatus]|nr:synaptotagmin-12-like [Macrosteles quadrilineatus]XP_054268373.1 synaptotagmin-12-like [Macrosteles quadrilineatus]